MGILLVIPCAFQAVVMWQFLKKSSMNVFGVFLQKGPQYTIFCTNFSKYRFCCLVTQSCPTLCNSMHGSMPGFPVLHHLPGLAQTHVHWVGDAIQPSHPLSSPSPAFYLSQLQDFSLKVTSLHQVAKVLKLQLQHQSFQWIFRVDFL